MPFLSKVPWFDFCFFVSQFEKIDEIVRQVVGIMSEIPEYMLRHKYETMRRYVRDVSWSHPGSRVVDNILRDSVSTCRI